MSNVVPGDEADAPAASGCMNAPASPDCAAPAPAGGAAPGVDANDVPSAPEASPTAAPAPEAPPALEAAPEPDAGMQAAETSDAGVPLDAPDAQAP